MKRTTLLIATSLSLVSCSTSTDPREGGLFGYWHTGDAGYQARVMNLQNQLSDVEENTAALNRRNSSLRAQKSRLSSLKNDARGLSGGVALMGRIQRAEAGAESDPNLEAKVRQLESEVRALKARQ